MAKVAKKTHHAESNTHVRGVKDDDAGIALLQRAEGDPSADPTDLSWDPVADDDADFQAFMQALFGEDAQADDMSEDEYRDLIGC